MIRRHTIDKFGHSLFLEEKRADKGDDKVDTILRVAASPKSKNDPVNKEYVDQNFATIHGVNDLETRVACLQTALKKIEAALLQTLIYVPETKTFTTTSGQKIDLVVHDSEQPIVVASSTSTSGFSTYGGTEYAHKNHIYLKASILSDYTGKKLVWDDNEAIIRPTY